MRAPPESQIPIIGQPVFAAKSHHLADFLTDDLRQRPAEHREVLGVSENLPSINVAVSGHYRITQEPLPLQPEVRRPVRDEPVYFCERAGVHQEFQPLSGRFLAALVLLVDSALSAAQRGLLAELQQVLKLAVVG